MNANHKPITSFRGEYEFLSNFYPCPVTIRFNRELTITFQNAEAAFQAHKSGLCEDLLKFENLTGSQAKKLGRKVKLREDWNDIKYVVMFQVVMSKFVQNPELGDKLKDTGIRQLIEGNTWNDTYWGVCNGIGENNLGKILMTVRDTLLRADMMSDGYAETLSKYKINIE